MLDGHQYLTNQGWKGKGNALKSGGIAKPLVVTQKKSLAGLGKDRDESFPFWEHVYSSSLKVINIKVHDSDSESDNDDPTSGTLAPEFKRTVTGIISNRKPLTGISAIPEASSASPSTSRLNLLASAKRDFARRQLYSRFYRGPVVANLELTPASTAPPTPSASTPSISPSRAASTSPTELPDVSALELIPGNTGSASSTSKKTKKRKRDEESTLIAIDILPSTSTSGIETKEERAQRKAARRARKDEKLARREAREAARPGVESTTPIVAVLLPALVSVETDVTTGRKKKRRRKEADEAQAADTLRTETGDDRDRAKKKRDKKDKERGQVDESTPS